MLYTSCFQYQQQENVGCSSYLPPLESYANGQSTCASTHFSVNILLNHLETKDLVFLEIKEIPRLH